MERDLETIISGNAPDTYAKIVRVALEAFASETPAASNIKFSNLQTAKPKGKAVFLRKEKAGL